MSSLTPLHRPSRKRRFQQCLYCCIPLRWRENVLPRNSSTRYNFRRTSTRKSEFRGPCIKRFTKLITSFHRQSHSKMLARQLGTAQVLCVFHAPKLTSAWDLPPILPNPLFLQASKSRNKFSVRYIHSICPQRTPLPQFSPCIRRHSSRCRSERADCSDARYTGRRSARIDGFVLNRAESGFRTSTGSGNQGRA
jgi:hypothetical protein